jgi:hypothetical protein
MKELLFEATGHVQIAKSMIDKYPVRKMGWKRKPKMLRDSTFYMEVSDEEKAALYAAMAQDFSGTGN